MTSDADVSWPPGNISAMIAEMRADLTSPHWIQVRLRVYGFARQYNVGSHECLTDAEDITQDVMWMLTRPGKLEAFGRKARVDPAKPGDEQVLRTAFLAWLAVMTRRRWWNFMRYVKARPDLASRASAANDDDDDDPTLMTPDPQADVTHIVEETMLLEAVTDFLRTLQERGPETARKVEQLLLQATSTMSYEEVARQFNCKATQVRDAIHNIRAKLRAQFSLQE
jgi:RNA polymerase sigma factor (sigma-70 family)